MAEIRIKRYAMGHFHTKRSVAPSATPLNAIFAGSIVYRIIFRKVGIGSFVIYVLNPLPDITRHVVKSIAVG